MNSIRIGDVVTLENTGNCFLSVDPVLRSVIWEISSGNSDGHFPFYLWRICPRLSYVDLELSKSRGRRNSFLKDSRQVATMENLIKKEEDRNLVEMKTNKSYIHYGQVHNINSSMILQ
jgi:hypothetical protein